MWSYLNSGKTIRALRLESVMSRRSRENFSTERGEIGRENSVTSSEPNSFGVVIQAMPSTSFSPPDPYSINIGSGGDDTCLDTFRMSALSRIELVGTVYPRTDRLSDFEHNVPATGRGVKRWR